MFDELKDRFFELPLWLDQRLRWSDLRRHRIEQTWLHKLGFVEGYSTLAFWLPLPVIVVFAYGLPKWRGWPLFFLCLGAILVHALIARLSKERWLPGLLWVWLGIVVAIPFALAPAGGGRQHDALPYAHIFGLFGFLVLTLGMPASRKWADWLIGRDRAWFRKEFATRLHQTQLFVKPPDPRHKLADDSKQVEKRRIRLLRSFALVAFSSVPMLAIVPALLVVLADAGWVWWFGGLGLVLWWALLAMAHYRERLKTFRSLVREALLVGGAAVVSYVVIVFAITRLAGVSYVTTVLDQRSRWVVIAIIGIFYLIFWLYDYWRERAAAEVLLGLLNDEDELHPTSIDYQRKPGARLSIHGAGRLMAVCPNPEDGFESYRPLEVFRRIVSQLEGRAREGKADWGEFDDASEALDALEEKGRLYSIVPALVIVILVAVGLGYVRGLEQRPGLEAVSVEHAPFDLGERLRQASAGETYYAVAASGGGTRAALYTYAVLRALRNAEVLERVVLLSGVSGGSAGVAYFAAHREELLQRPIGDEVWTQYRDALAGDHIKRVLAGVGEWRFLEGERLGKLLTESFEDHFLPAECSTIGCADVGLIFNTSVAGAWRSGERNSDSCLEERGAWRKCATVDRTGTRLVITNLDSITNESMKTVVAGWPLDFEYEVVRDSRAPLATAASMSANFPPIFSNTAVHLDGESDSNQRRYWLTDGGAVENRGLISLLLALRVEAREWTGDQPPPAIKILVAEASGMSVTYSEDRGIGAAGAAKRQIADKLIAELAADWKRLSGGRSTAELVYLPMPEVLRSGFGTHWQLPAKVQLHDPTGWFLNSKLKFWRRPEKLTLDKRQIEEVVHLLYAEERTEDLVDPKLWEWAAVDEDGQDGDPRCKLYEAIGFVSSACSARVGVSVTQSQARGGPLRRRP